MEIPISSERVVFNAAGLIPRYVSPLTLSPWQIVVEERESTKRQERDSDDDGSLAIITVVSG